MTSLFQDIPPRPWRVMPPGFGDPAFLRAADDKTVCHGLRTEQVGEAIAVAVNEHEALLAVAKACREYLDVLDEKGIADDDNMGWALAGLEKARGV